MNYILTEIIEKVCFIKLNRPDVLNSFNREMALGLIAALQKCASDDKIRAILLTAEGRAFCAGQDLKEVIGENALPLDQVVREHYNEIIKQLRTIEKPIICAVNGVAAGAGANIALACDITFAGDKASFIQAFSAIGLIPDSGGTFTLPKLIGMQRASALAFLGEKVSAKDAETMGLIYRCIEQENLFETALATATKLSEMPTYGIGLTKRAFNASLNNDLTSQLQLEEELQVLAGNSHDYNEGVSAFLEKRKPNFTGK